jgi:GNAT superfamily N-acetyltransferase
VIRPAVPDDADGIARTFLESAEYHAELDPERYSIPPIDTIVARYREGRQHPSHAGREAITLVAELSGEIVGFIDARLERSLDAMHREMIYCHIAEIGVRRGHRNQGIGGRLLRAAEDWGRRLGAEFASLEISRRKRGRELVLSGANGLSPGIHHSHKTALTVNSRVTSGLRGVDPSCPGALAACSIVFQLAELMDLQTIY